MGIVLSMLVAVTSVLPALIPPVAVLTVENVEQAVERSGPGAGNKGEEAAIGAIEMANVLKALRSQQPK